MNAIIRLLNFIAAIAGPVGLIWSAIQEARHRRTVKPVVQAVTENGPAIARAINGNAANGSSLRMLGMLPTKERDGRERGWVRLLLLAMLASFLATCVVVRLAHAEPTYGPTGEALRVDLGTHHSVTYAAGVGYEVGYGWLPRVIAGRTVDLISAQLAVFAQNDAGALRGASAASACLYGAVCVGVGIDDALARFVLVSLDAQFAAHPDPAPASQP